MWDLRLSNCIRFLGIDAIERARSGHPGMVMGMADFFTVLYGKFLRFSPKDPKWYNRDRLILSAGHGSMLLYSALFLTGYHDITIDDIKNFRQLNSKTPGHPEYRCLDGIEVTTGPLGQGIANAVGMALAAKMLASRFGDDLINHKVYCIVGDGCLMEGISQEAMSFAVHFGLDNLVLVFDDNGITIDGATSLTTSENNMQRALACGFETRSVDGHDIQDIERALSLTGKSEKPVFLNVKTIIGFGSVILAGSHNIHGCPLGAAEVQRIRDHLSWEYDAFEIPDDLLHIWRHMHDRCSDFYHDWYGRYESQKGRQLRAFISGIDTTNRDFLTHVGALCKDFKLQNLHNITPEATRNISGRMLELVAGAVPNLIGGGADLSSSVCTKVSYMTRITGSDFSNRYIHYGAREHLMSALMNGISIYGGFLPYAGTFLAFSDYMRPAMRMSALMRCRVLYIFSHDSIALGQDGPTHQPVEHLHTLGCIPNMLVFRPCDAFEVAESFAVALAYDGPSSIILTKQDLKPVREVADVDLECNVVSRGAYFFQEPVAAICHIYASGSEIPIAMEVKRILAKQDVKAVNVISVPCKRLFHQQNADYIDSILGHKIKLKVGIEAGIKDDLLSFIGTDGLFFGVEEFGLSAPGDQLLEYFGITAKKIAAAIVKRLSQ